MAKSTNQSIADQEQTKTRHGSILNSGGAAQTNAIQRQALTGSRLKIPLLFGYDVIHGYRTSFPIPRIIVWIRTRIWIR